MAIPEQVNWLAFAIAVEMSQSIKHERGAMVTAYSSCFCPPTYKMPSWVLVFLSRFVSSMLICSCPLRKWAFIEYEALGEIIFIDPQNRIAKDARKT